MTVRVMADSASNLPADLLARYDIGIVPMVLKFGDREYLDGVDLDNAEFYRALVTESVPVSTAAPGIGAFRDGFEAALAGADEVVCLTVASFLSATHDAAVAASRDFAGRVHVVDSRSASLGEALPVVEAARVAADEGSVAEVIARANDVAARTSFVATINTFEFLRRSGRVNSLMAYAATTLNIKPIFAFRGGKVEQLGRPRSRARALDRLIEELRKAGTPKLIGVAHADCADEAAALAERARAEAPGVELLLSEFTPLMGAHTGPGLLGLGFWT